MKPTEFDYGSRLHLRIISGDDQQTTLVFGSHSVIESGFREEKESLHFAMNPGSNI